MLTAIEFFAGSGLVRSGLRPDFTSIWANDICQKKRATYMANFPEGAFQLANVKDVHGSQIPACHLAWASFPCQDLSLAGNMNGMAKGTRSGLFWEWIRILWEMRALGRCPSVLAVENVVGFLVADGGAHFQQAYEALRELGYRVGGLVVNAKEFVPQSRPRAFVIAVRDGVLLDGLTQASPSEPFHTKALIRAAKNLQDDQWVWWSLPIPSTRVLPFSMLCEVDVAAHSKEETNKMLRMLSPAHRLKLDALVASGQSFVGTAYRRTRQNDHGTRQQMLELRFDNLAGCLRTPDGGSSRQTVILIESGKVTSRLMTVRECARLMGAPDNFKLPGTYNDAYRAMGDGVAVPVTHWLSTNLLAVVARRAAGIQEQSSSNGFPLEGQAISTFAEVQLHA